MEIYQFFLELLYPLPLRHKKMFGVNAFYLEDKMVFALRQKENTKEDNGVWIATKAAHHQKLKHQIKDLRGFVSYPIKSWILLPEDSDEFENSCALLAALIKKRSELVGIIPKPKKKKS